MPTLMERLKVEEDRLDQEQEDTHGQYEKMKLVFEKKIQLYKRYLKKGELTDQLERLALENKKEWNMSHLLSLMIREELATKVSDLTKRVYRLENEAQQE